MAASPPQGLRRLDRGPLLYEPHTEQGVVALFAALCEERYGLRIKVIRQDYPDCIAVDRRGQEVKIEFEFESSRFNHQDLSQCDQLVCWIDNDKPEARWRKGGIRAVELRPLFPEVGADVWIQPYRPHNVEILDDVNVYADGWTVPSRARKGDMLLVYCSGRKAALTHVMELASNATFERRHGWGRGFQARLKKIFDLPEPVPRSACLADRSLRDCSFFKRPTPLGQSVLGEWPALRRMMLKHNPRVGLARALEPFTLKPQRVVRR